MISPRFAIRQAIKSRLSAQLPAWDERLTESRISINRNTPLFAAKLPAILIYTRDERIEDSPNADPGLRYRKLDLSVEVVAGGDKAEEDVEQIILAVESILDADETLGLSVEGMRLTRIELDQDGEGEGYV